MTNSHENFQLQGTNFSCNVLICINSLKSYCLRERVKLVAPPFIHGLIIHGGGLRQWAIDAVGLLCPRSCWRCLAQGWRFEISQISKTWCDILCKTLRRHENIYADDGLHFQLLHQSARCFPCRRCIRFWVGGVGKIGCLRSVIR